MTKPIHYASRRNGRRERYCDGRRAKRNLAGWWVYVTCAECLGMHALNAIQRSKRRVGR